jgi:hypothetical protein
MRFKQKKKSNFLFFIFLLKKDSLRKLTEDLNKRISELRDTTRIRDDDGDRTSRVREMEKELNSVLDENNVCRFFSRNKKKIFLLAIT